MAYRKSYNHLVGQKFCALTVTGVERDEYPGRTRVFVRVRCACGTRFRVPPDQLGKTKSCGCQTSAIITASKITHGASRRRKWSAEYGVWAGMIQRCTNPNVKAYPYYGAIGVRVCSRWRRSFPAFFADVGPRPSPQHSLDRYPDNAGNYEPGNVRWATRLQQRHNRRGGR